MSEVHHHIFEDGGFTARLRAVEGTVSFLLELWASDLSVFTGGEKTNDPTTPDAWLKSILQPLRQDGRPVMFHAAGPNDQLQSYIIQPFPPNHHVQD